MCSQARRRSTRQRLLYCRKAAYHVCLPNFTVMGRRFTGNRRSSRSPRSRFIRAHPLSPTCWKALDSLNPERMNKQAPTAPILAAVVKLLALNLKPVTVFVVGVDFTAMVVKPIRSSCDQDRVRAMLQAVVLRRSRSASPRN